MRRQRGAALLALLAVFALGASWFLVSRLNEESNALVVAQRNRNADVLNRAKQALIGYVAAQAAKALENRPGALPCPEAPADYEDASNEGTVAYPCTLPAVGRFPWRTLGLDKLVDASGTPLWYAIAPGWAGASTVINSNCASYDASSTQACRAGRLSVDGVVDEVIALIIAPGPPLAAAATTGCAAGLQTRNRGEALNRCDYLEGENATSPADVSFATTGPSATFNDQVVKITVGELMPAVEAAVANRMEREIAPALKTVYATSAWATGLAASTPLFPYPAPFANPTTSSYQGSAASSGGLLPLFQTQGCTPASDPRCTTATTGPSAFLVFSKSGNDSFVPLINPLNLLELGWIRTQSTCSWAGQSFNCRGEYQAFPIAVTLRLRVTNVAMGLRTFDPSKITCTAVDDVGAGLPSQNIGCASTSVALQSNGSAIVTVTTNWTPSIVLSGWGTYANYVISFDRAVFGDHALLDTGNAATGWFVRNKWHEVTYYAVAAGHTAAALPAMACTTSVNCISVANVTPTGAQRALMILAGRSVNGTARPSATLADYLEFGNAGGSFERQTVTRAPRSMQADTGIANAYAVASTSVAAGSTVNFVALNANTGPATLSTAATGPRNLVNADGTVLAAGAIRAKAALTTYYDGTQFLVHKRPFNDRVIVVDTN